MERKHYTEQEVQLILHRHTQQAAREFQQSARALKRASSACFRLIFLVDEYQPFKPGSTDEALYGHLQAEYREAMRESARVHYRWTQQLKNRPADQTRKAA